MSSAEALAATLGEEVRKLPPPSPPDDCAVKKQRVDAALAASVGEGETSSTSRLSYRATLEGSNLNEDKENRVFAVLKELFGSDQEMTDAQSLAAALMAEIDAEADVTFVDKGNSFVMEIPDALEDKLAKVWSQTVVVKLLGRELGFNILTAKIKSMWKLSRGFKVIDLDKNFFLIRFELPDDFRKALLDGPWMILGRYLMVQAWTPNFSPNGDTLTKVGAWIRLPGMPIHCFHKKVLRVLGNKLGRLLRIDYNTSSSERGKFARIAVELDISKPLPPSFEFKGEE